MGNGTMMSCGNNSDGQLGRKYTSKKYIYAYDNAHDIFEYIYDFVSNSRVIKVVCGCYNTYVLLEDGTIMNCGSYNDECHNLGRLIDVDHPEIFTKVPDITGVVDIACEGTGSHLLLNDGTIMGCGQNLYGQLGFGDNVTRDTFSFVPEISGVVKIISGGSYVFLLLNDGSIMSCGMNISGQLGIGNNEYRNTFTRVTIQDNLTIVSPNNESSCLVPADGTILQVACGAHHTFILLNDGTLMSSGCNQHGQLGLGDDTNRNTFTEVIKEWMADGIVNGVSDMMVKRIVYRTSDFLTYPKSTYTNITKVVCGGYCTFLLLRDNTIMCCGQNVYGELGLGDNRNRSIFTKVPDITNVVNIMCGAFFAFLLLKDGAILSCGHNESGQLGLGDNKNRNIFTKVPVT